MNVIRNCFSVTSLITILSIPAIANAALVGRDLDDVLTTAEAYYDNATGLTWLADANYSQTSGYDADGLMSWANAKAWTAGLDVSGFTGWRLPDTVQPDATCDIQSSGVSYGDNCTGSEMGNLFYTELGGVAGSSIATTHNANYDLFSNVQANFYRSATEWSLNNSYAWGLHFGTGYQSQPNKTSAYYAWAVQTGDIGAAVSTVPVPAAVWLFGSGIIGLMGFAKRKSLHVFSNPVT